MKGATVETAQILQHLIVRKQLAQTGKSDSMHLLLLFLLMGTAHHLPQMYLPMLQLRVLVLGWLPVDHGRLPLLGLAGGARDMHTDRIVPHRLLVGKEDIV